MNEELKYLLGLTAKRKFSRRAFLGRAATMGMSAAVANTMLAGAVRAEGPKKGGVLRLGLGGGAGTDTLDPALAAGHVPFHLTRQFGETLVNVTPSGEIEYRLAESIDSSSDASTWYFRIRKGVEFHHGKTLTAEDALKTLQRHSDKSSQSQAVGLMMDIVSMRADGDVVEIALSAPNADFAYLMAERMLVIQAGGGFGNPADGNGTGPYKVVEAAPGVRYLTEKFANYWDEGSGHFDQVETLVINDATARNSALQSGQVHMINGVDPKLVEFLGRSPGVQIKNVSGRGHYVFPMFCNTAPFDNNDLRMALKYAINRQEMVDKILRGFGSIGNDIPINASYPLFDHTIEQREYDPERAAFHYKASGHDGSLIVLHTSGVAFPGAVEASQLFQQSAVAAGIPLEIKREPGDGYWSDVWNVKPFVASFWAGRPVQDQMYSTAYLSNAPYNDTRFHNETFDSLIVQAKGEIDPAKRKSLYGEAARILRDEGGLICPMFNDFIDAHSDKVAGWQDNPNNEMMNGFAATKCWFA
jgi:peptide/nickel transport system substrate-binding protein